MKKGLILALVGGFLLATSSGVFAEEQLVPVLDGTDAVVAQDEMPVSDDEILNTESMVYPNNYPSTYHMFQTTASVNGAECYVMFEKLNALRVSRGLNPLILDSTLTFDAMYRASEICLVYQHSNPGGSYGEEYDDEMHGGSGENIVVGRDSGSGAYDAFAGSGAHWINMTKSYWNYVGIGNYGGAWVMVFDTQKGYQSHILSQSELVSTYTTSSRLARTVVDQDPDDIQHSDGLKYYFTPKLLTGGNTSTTKAITIDRGVSQQLQPIIYPWPYESYLKEYNGLGTKLVPSSLTWTSSSPSVASVDSNGIVTGKTSGTSTITGTLYDQSITYTITVTGNGTTPVDLGDYCVKYRTHVENIGWQSYVSDGAMAGTEGRSLRLEGINIALGSTINGQAISGGIEYRTHVQDIGWQNYVANGTMAGTEGRCLRLEGINIRLIGDIATKYDVYYRVHTQNIGWMGWAKNDEPAGSAGFSYRLEGIQIKLVPKGGAAPGSTENAFVEADMLPPLSTVEQFIKEQRVTERVAVPDTAIAPPFCPATVVFEVKKSKSNEMVPVEYCCLDV